MPITISGSTGIAGVDGSASTPAIQGTDTNTGVTFPAADTVAVATGGTERMRIDSSGNVGIGTSSPSAKLHVSGAAASSSVNSQLTNTDTGALSAAQFIVSTGGGVNGAFYAYGTSAAYLSTSTNHPLAFQTNNIERARFDVSGNFLLASPTTVSFANTPVSVARDVRLIFGGGGSLANAQSSTFYWRRAYDNVDVAAVNGAGSFFSLSNSYGALSDPRYKENIEPARNYLNDLCRLRVVRYSLKIENAEKPTQLGLLSSDVKEVFPSLVTYTNETDAEGNLTGNVIEGVKYSVLVPMLLTAIQEQQSIIEDLKARITALEAK